MSLRCQASKYAAATLAGESAVIARVLGVVILVRSSWTCLQTQQ
jgi:hypothetical protein